MSMLTKGQSYISSTEIMISEINELINSRLDKEWMAKEWQKKEDGTLLDTVHPLVNIAYTAHQQINHFMETNTTGITKEIFELAELAIKTNSLFRHSVTGLQNRLQRLISSEFSLYQTTKYEIQIAGMLLERGHNVEFIEEGEFKTPDILVKNALGECEVECKHKDPEVDQIDYIRSLYNNTQTARKQFSKKRPGIIAIEVDKNYFDDFLSESKRLDEEINRAMRNSSSISAILLTSKIITDDQNDYIYRHRVLGFLNPTARYSIPKWLAENLVNY